MKEPTVVRLEETERVSFGPLSHYQLIIGDDEGTTPVRTGIQTAQPGYAAPVHQHPYVEILHILDGVAEAWIDGREHEAVTLRKGDTMAIPPDTPHAFRVIGDETLRLLGTHASPKRIVDYKDGAGTRRRRRGGPPRATPRGTPRGSRAIRADPRRAGRRRAAGPRARPTGTSPWSWRPCAGAGAASGPASARPRCRAR